MKITLASETEKTGNKSAIQTFDIDPGDAAVMVDTDRCERAAKAGMPVDEVVSRTPQQIADELSRMDENNAHQYYRDDYKFFKGIVSWEARAARENEEPDPAGSPEDELIAREEAVAHQTKLEALREAREEVLTERQRLMIHLMFDEKLSAAAIARELGISRTGVKSQIEASIEKLQAAVVNKCGISGSGVSGVASGATSTSQKGK